MNATRRNLVAFLLGCAGVEVAFLSVRLLVGALKFAALRWTPQRWSNSHERGVQRAMPKPPLPVTLALLPFLLHGGAHVGGVAIRSLLTGSGGQIPAGSNSFVVVKRTRDLTRFELAVIAANMQGNRILDLILAVKSTRLNPGELELLKGNATYAATRCFGLDTAALPAFNSWLEQLNAGMASRDTAQFGKLNAVFVRQNKPGAPYLTVELYRDADRPGVAPWLNYCTR